MTKKIRAVGAALLVTVWASLTLFAWLHPAEASSDTERRPLAQFPELNASTVLSGKFMSEFEDYTLDQFPGRDRFRTLKALVHYNVFGQQDNNGIYIEDGYAAKLEYPRNDKAVGHALKRLNFVYDTFLKDTDCKLYAAVVPDKGYYLAEANGYPAMDYAELFTEIQTQMPWATYVDLTDCLTVEDYYYTDTHWRQECILPVAQRLCEAMSAAVPQEGDYTQTKLERPFYGVYYGQAALPMDPEPMYLMESQLLQDCTVYNYTTQKESRVYDLEKLEAKDLYEVYLSGPQSLLRIDNPNAKSDRELVIFRDSFGSSITPLLVQEYKTVTLVDIRYMSSQMLQNFVEFENQDVLFLYSTLVLNLGSNFR